MTNKTALKSAANAKADQTMTDDELIALARAGNQEACTLIHNRFKSIVRASCREVINNPLDLEDAVQETFTFVFTKGLAKFEGRSSFSTWIWGVAMRATQNYNRLSKSRNIIFLDPLLVIPAREALRDRLEICDDDGEGIVARMQRKNWIPTLLWYLEEWPKTKVREFMGWTKAYGARRFAEIEDDLAEALEMSSLAPSTLPVKELRKVKASLPDIKKLPLAKRPAYLMYIGGYTYDEISQDLRLNIKRVRIAVCKAKSRLAEIEEQKLQEAEYHYDDVDKWVTMAKQRRKPGVKSISLIGLLDKIDRQFLKIFIHQLILIAPSAGFPTQEFLAYKTERRPTYKQIALKVKDPHAHARIAYGTEWLVRRLIVHHISGKPIRGLSKGEFEQLVGRLRSNLMLCVPSKNRNCKHPRAARIYG